MVLEDKYFDKKDGGDDGSEDGNDKGKVGLNSCHNLVSKDEFLNQCGLLFLDKAFLVVGSDSWSTCEYFYIAAVNGYLRGLLKPVDLPDGNHEVQVVICHNHY